MARKSLVPAAAFLLVASSGASAATLLYANLTTSQETGVPRVPTTSTGDPRPTPYGFATLELNDAQTALMMSVTIFNIDVTGGQTTDTFDNLGAAHIHAPAPPGASTGVKWGFFGTPDNDNNPDNLLLTPFASGVGGTFTSIWNQPEGNATTLTAQIPDILAGLSYLNFHTTQYGAGEIRGQIFVVPEPSAGVLAALGIAGLFGIRRWRR
jgi:hypothetical protein